MLTLPRRAALAGALASTAMTSSQRAARLETGASRNAMIINSSNGVAMNDSVSWLNSGLGTPSAGAAWKAAFGFRAGSQRGTLNGAAMVSNTLGSIQGPSTTLSIGGANGALNLFGWITRAAYWPYMLADATMQAQTR